jgi:Skp family chaperone for outer membrane proteins
MINLAKTTLLTLLFALSFSMQTSAQTTAANNAQAAASIPRKADGSVDFDKWFEGKNRDQQYEMADSLTDLQDEKAYRKYLLAENAKKKTIIISKNNDWISLLTRRAALNNGNVGDENKQNIRKALLDPHIPNEIKDKLRLFLNE